MSLLRCSNCSQPVRPVVAIDIDGTMGDYHAHFLRFAASWLRSDETQLLLELSVSPYNGGIPFSQYCMEMMEIDLATYRLIKLAYRQGGMKRSMPMFVGARDTVHRMYFAGAEVWVTTTRPYLSLDNIVPDTVEWCRRNLIDYDGMLFDEDKYKQLADRVDPERVVAIIDDLSEMCDAANESFDNVAIMVERPHNNNTLIPYPRLPLMSAGKVAAMRVKEWIDNHA